MDRKTWFASRTACRRIHLFERVENYITGRKITLSINPLNAELNPTCHLLALLRAHHIIHVSGVRVNPLNT